MPRPSRIILRLTALVLAGAALSGCEKPIFTPEEFRSQYDRVDAVRDERASSYLTDEYGNRRPNLNGRLSRLR